MAFDVEAARKEGYSDKEIADHLAQQHGYDVSGARGEGHSDTDIIQHLTGAPVKPTVAPGQIPPGEESVIGAGLTTAGVGALGEATAKVAPHIKPVAKAVVDTVIDKLKKQPEITPPNIVPNDSGFTQNYDPRVKSTAEFNQQQSQAHADLAAKREFDAKKLAHEKANPGRTLTPAGLDVPLADAQKMAAEEAKAQARIQAQANAINQAKLKKEAVPKLISGPKGRIASYGVAGAELQQGMNKFAQGENTAGALDVTGAGAALATPHLINRPGLPGKLGKVAGALSILAPIGAELISKAEGGSIQHFGVGGVAKNVATQTAWNTPFIAEDIVNLGRNVAKGAAMPAAKDAASIAWSMAPINPVVAGLMALEPGEAGAGSTLDDWYAKKAEEKAYYDQLAAEKANASRRQELYKNVPGFLNEYMTKSPVTKFNTGGEVQHFDEGGGAYVGYPQIHNRPRKQGYLSGLIEGATGLGDSDNLSVLDPNAQAYMRGKDIGEPIGLATMIPVNPASAVRGTAKFLAPKAASMAENYMVRQGLISPIVGEAAKPMVDRINMHYKDVTKRIPELQESAKKMLSGAGTREEHETLVNTFKPVKPFEFVPKPATREEAINALHKDQKELYGVPSQTLQAGHPVGLRLDIPAYSKHGVWVPTIHEQASGFGAGKSIGHESVASVLNPSFGMSEKAALNIAAGKNKATIATIKGEWNPVNQEQAVANAQDYLNHPEWRQVGMDPERHGYFYDRATMEPITSAEEALQIGPLVLARKPVYGKKEDFKFSEGGEVQHFQVGRIVKKVVGEAFDPRFDKRVIEQNKLKNLTTNLEQTGVVDVPSINLGNYVDYPVITSMSDRTFGGHKLLGVNDVTFNNPVDLTGGKLYMYNNPGQGWASGQQPVNQIMKLAHQLKQETGKNPLYIPWRMAPSASDFSHMTGETMLAHAQANMGRADKKTFDNTIKKFIPDWAGVDNPLSLQQYREAPAVVRKSMQNAIDRDLRGSGALGIGETRLAIADPAQINAPEGGLSHVAQIFADKPIIQNSGNVTYPKGVPGQGLGKLDQDLIVTQLLPNMVKERGIVDPRNPSAQDLRALQMKPYATTLSPEILKSIGLKKGGLV